MSEFFPKGQERKKTVEQVAQEAAHFKDIAEIEILDFEHYTWADSSLDGSDKGSFVNSFRDLLPGEEISLRNYIETALKERKGSAIGVEFGGIGARLFSGFTPDFFAKSIAVSLLDHRGWAHQLDRIKERDKKLHHEVLEGNIFESNTYKSLNQWLNGEKVDLIIERMGKGLEFVPGEPYEVSKILRIWYNLLREGGIMFAQTPVVFNNLLEAWAVKIDREFKGKIEIEFQTGYEDDGVACSAFRLRKLSGAPNELPLLDPKTVGKIPKADFKKYN
ncbi:MAG: hypothetical protein HY433_03850 [Candidatus Liptonbacteria bacterium]|nr:hypothetical protein [Candidatus Liptonbacteria bacterium]